MWPLTNLTSHLPWSCLAKGPMFSFEQAKIIQTKIDKLLATGFIRDVKYPDWLANVVVVPNKDGEWQVCVDYTNLNNVCPKDNVFTLDRSDSQFHRHAWDALLPRLLFRISLDPYVLVR